jgi:hypothetical protein
MKRLLILLLLVCSTAFCQSSLDKKLADAEAAWIAIESYEQGIFNPVNREQIAYYGDEITWMYYSMNEQDRAALKDRYKAAMQWCVNYETEHK